MHELDAITLLNRLIVTSKNSEHALRAAAEEAHHAELKQSLLEYSRFFADAAHEMQEAVTRLGGHPAGHGTFGNTVHRFYLHLKANATGRDEGVILDTVERDEADAEARFEEAVIHWETPPEIHAMLERQFEGARRRHDAIRQMRERLATLH